MKVQYYNLYAHFVFTTKDRRPIINKLHRDRIEKYITGIVNNHKCKMYAIYANPDHVHFLVSRDPDMSDNELADLITNASEIFINNNKMCKCKFYWQSKGICVGGGYFPELLRGLLGIRFLEISKVFIIKYFPLFSVIQTMRN